MWTSCNYDKKSINIIHCTVRANDFVKSSFLAILVLENFFYQSITIKVNLARYKDRYTQIMCIQNILNIPYITHSSIWYSDSIKQTFP